MKKISIVLFISLLMLVICGCSNDSGECKHTFGSWITISESTCSTQGKEARICSKCQYTEENLLPLVSHKTIKLEAVEATCLGEGLKEGLICTECATIVKEQESIPPKGHSFSNGVCHCGATIGTRQIIVSSCETTAGSVINVTVALNGNPGIASLILSLEYDEDVMTLENIKYNDTISGTTMLPEENNSPIKLYWINAFSNQEGDFVLATLSFKIKDNAPKGTHYITLSYDRDNVYNQNEQNVYFDIINGKITVN